MTTLTTHSPIKLVQITDTHLYGTASGTLLKMNTQDSMDHVVKIVRENEEKIDFILATGDIAQDASLDAYQNFIKAMGDLSAPFRWIPGNHDSARVMEEAANGTDACEKLVQINNWQIIFLDTSIEGQVHGRLSQGELDFLDDSLAKASESGEIEHCLVCLHHNPVKGNAGWMRDIGLHNRLQFFNILKQYPKVACIVYGHVHQDLDFEHEGIRCLCTPSTCIQFKPNVTNFALDRLNPGYRTIQLHEDGSIDTEVVRVTGYTFEADFSSGGY
ncbi:MAG: 3',5'-cyclic-AMP phosphodiesterase [Pseudomonadales bacterium]|nr:3',5'-cyclic-AMP phosphodiesterase [Pseudomonadales bacterium]